MIFRPLPAAFALASSVLATAFAAPSVCGPPLPTGTRIPYAAWQACMADAVKAAVKRVDRPLLSAYYDARIDGVQRRATRVAASH